MVTPSLLWLVKIVLLSQLTQDWALNSWLSTATSKEFSRWTTNVWWDYQDSPLMSRHSMHSWNSKWTFISSRRAERWNRAYSLTLLPHPFMKRGKSYSRVFLIIFVPLDLDHISSLQLLLDLIRKAKVNTSQFLWATIALDACLQLRTLPSQEPEHNFCMVAVKHFISLIWSQSNYLRPFLTASFQRWIEIPSPVGALMSIFSLEISSLSGLSKLDKIECANRSAEMINKFLL